MTKRVFFLLMLTMAAHFAPAEGLAVSETDLLGVWKMSYAPDLAGRQSVLEPSSGFLFIIPGNRYYELRQDCCGPTSFMGEPLAYRIEGHRVILSSKRSNGERYEREMQFVPATAVVFFDGLNLPPVTTSTLQTKGGVNYGYGKVYP